MQNKLAFIVGGSGTIGLEIVNLFKNSHYKIVVLDNKNIFKGKTNIYYEKLELKEISKIENNIKKIIKYYGIPHVLINASYPITKNWTQASYRKIKLKYFIDNLSLHLGSYYWISKLVADFMSKKKRGSIIMISSIYSLVAQDPEMYIQTTLKDNQAYPIIKAGINAAAKQMASFYGSCNVRVNTISPGGMEGAVKGSKLKQDLIFKKKYLKKLCIKRFCKPQDVAQACLYLADDEKSSYLTGQNIVLDGGYTSR
jgi:NAD(P)-dependent dehydrogenase (short-subunit alcohol dehydrogenase family)